jgi:hypothetical protein
MNVKGESLNSGSDSVASKVYKSRNLYWHLYICRTCGYLIFRIQYNIIIDSDHIGYFGYYANGNLKI